MEIQIEGMKRVTACRRVLGFLPGYSAPDIKLYDDWYFFGVFMIAYSFPMPVYSGNSLVGEDFCCENQMREKKESSMLLSDSDIKSNTMN